MRRDLVDATVNSPLTAIASDGYLANGKGHPRTAGCYSKILGQYVRESKTLSLIDALRKIALMPAHRLESWAPAFKKKGRVKVGADADLIAFDMDQLTDKSTYEHPTLAPEGMRYVLVNGISVVVDGKIKAGVSPGKGIRSTGA